MLELWQDDADMAARPQPQEAKDLPTTFGDTFSAAWSRNNLFGQNYTGEIDRLHAFDDYLGTIKQKTGEDIGPQLDYGTEPGTMSSGLLLQQANQKLAELKAKNPALDLDPMTPDQLEQNGLAKRRQADADFAELAGRQRGPGATAGLIAGGLAAGVADPINIAALPVAPEESLGILANSLRWAAIGAGTQAISEAIQAPRQEEVEPGYLASGAPLAHIAETAAFAGVGAGIVRGLGDAWERVSKGAWPTSVRDAGNVVASQGNIIASNVYPGPEGEAAHVQALSTAIDHILAGMPVKVDEIITPELEAQSRNLMARLEGERAVSLPVFDERSIRLTSEEAGLRQQHAELGAELGSLPEGDISAADRLNRLQAVDAQLQTATGDMRRALLQRRDQILVDTTPEALQAGAEPIARRQELGAQQGRIAGRLEEIAAERRQIEAQNLSSLPQANIGQTTPVRAAPVEAIRTHAMEAMQTAERLRSQLGLTEKAPQLPFEQTAAEGQAEVAKQALTSGVQQIARRGGYAMPAEEAAQISAKLLKASPEEAETTLRNLQMSPRQVAEAPARIEAPAEEPRTEVTPVKEVTPELLAAQRADLDRELVAYHGSPYEFERFDLGKIGTGEGGQAYGHGLYFADKAETAETYKISPRSISPEDALKQAKQDLAELEKNLKDPNWAGHVNPEFDAAALDFTRRQVEALKGLKPGPSLYKVRIGAGSKDFFDLDKAANDPSQPAALRKVFEKNGMDLTGATDGHDAYRQLSTRLGSSEAASKALREAGIPGIKYFDAGSRNAPESLRPEGGLWKVGDKQFPNYQEAQAYAEKIGTRNYVVFDPNIVNIMERNAQRAAGTPLYPDLQKALDEVDGYKTAAEQLASCAAPEAEAKAA